MSVSDFHSLKDQCNNFEKEEDREALESDLIFLALFAFQDNLRDNVQTAVAFSGKAGINVRMVSADHMSTAKQSAIKAGILSEQEAE